MENRQKMAGAQKRKEQKAKEAEDQAALDRIAAAVKGVCGCGGLCRCVRVGRRPSRAHTHNMPTEKDGKAAQLKAEREEKEARAKSLKVGVSARWRQNLRLNFI